MQKTIFKIQSLLFTPSFLDYDRITVNNSNKVRNETAFQGVMNVETNKNVRKQTAYHFRIINYHSSH